MNEKASNQRSELGIARYQPNRVVIHGLGSTFNWGCTFVHQEITLLGNRPRKVAVQLALPAHPRRRRKGDGNQIIDQPAAGEIDGGGERT